MRKVSILLAVVVMVAMVTPAMAQYWVGPQTGGDWNVAANWNTAQDGSGTSGVPAATAYANVRKVYGTEADPDISGAIINIAADTDAFKVRLGYWRQASGHLVVNSNVTFEATGYLAIGEYLNMDPTYDVPPAASVTQSTGRVLSDTILIGHAADCGPLHGNGIYTISGGTMGSWWGGIKNGDYHAGSSSTGKGLFRVIGDAASIGTSATYHEYVRTFKQTAISRSEFVLTSTGTVSPINMIPRSDHTYANMRVSLEGSLQVDPTTNGYTPDVGDKVALCVINNGITGYSRDDLLNYKAGDDFDNWDTAAPVTLDAPAGWGLIDDGLGTLSAKFTLGDVTESGYVDGSDLDEVLAKWGTTQVLDDVNPRWLGDVTCDETVNGSDLDYVLAGWGQGTPPPVPEPITLTLLGFGGLALLRRRR